MKSICSIALVFIFKLTLYAQQYLKPDIGDLHKAEIQETVNRIFGKVNSSEGIALDSGLMIAYRIPESGKYLPITEVNVLDGNFLIDSLANGNYLCVTFTNDDRFIPTYVGNVVDWVDAVNIILEDNDVSVEDYVMVARPPESTVGDGQVAILIESFFLEDEGRVENRRRVRKAGCSLRRRTSGGGRPEQGDFVLFAYKETDDFGQVNFGNIPEGDYLLNIQFPGIPMDTASFIRFTIDENQTNLDLFATITDNLIIVDLIETLSSISKNGKRIKIFPNPSNDFVFLDFNDLDINQYTFKIHDLNGKIQLKDDIDLNQNSQRSYQISLENLKGGIYTIEIYPSTKDQIIGYFKIIVIR